jgi:hypothetical protein
MTQTIPIGEGRAYVFVAVEHANSEVVTDLRVPRFTGFRSSSD